MALVFFDLDGTLTRFDTFIPYCMIALLHRPKRIFAIRPVLKACIGFFGGESTRHRLKEEFLITFLGGLKRSEIARINRVFMGFFLPFLTRKKLVGKLRWHRGMGDLVFIVSASPDVYVLECVRQWKLDGAICTILQWENGCLTGRILGRNCRGKEKASRIRTLFNKTELNGSFGYGNSDGDRQMLELVTFGIRI